MTAREPGAASFSVLGNDMLKAVPHSLASIVGIAARSAGPVLAHCAAGKDRTGVAIAVLLLAGGVEPASIIADYTATASRMSALLGRLQGLGRQLPVTVDANSELLGAPAEAIAVVIERLMGWPGGPQAWIADTAGWPTTPGDGVTGWQLDNLNPPPLAKPARACAGRRNSDGRRVRARRPGLSV